MRMPVFCQSWRWSLIWHLWHENHTAVKILTFYLHHKTMFVNSLHTYLPRTVSLTAGLGDHQAGTEQHCHLLGGQDEPPAAHWLPEPEEAAATEERCEPKERIGRQIWQLLLSDRFPRRRKKGSVLRSCLRFDQFLCLLDEAHVRTRVTLCLKLLPWFLSKKKTAKEVKGGKKVYWYLKTFARGKQT